MMRVIAIALLYPCIAWGSSLQTWATLRATQEAPGDAALLIAILGQESSLCTDKHRLDPLSYGCGQLRVKTARMFAPKVTAKVLLRDDRLNIHISAQYLAYCRAHTDSWYRAAICHHRGEPTANAMTEAEVFEDPYLLAIQRRMQ